MDFSQMNEEIIATAQGYCDTYSIEPSKEFAVLKLYEEVGEFAQAFLIHERMSRPEKFMDEKDSRERMAQELADVVGMSLFVAHVLGIDMEKALQKKWTNRV
ncbi:MAG: MazG-like family protein [Parcubacteria group bacterium]|jgi:NTP pyrophosphatase (non-canonical NTP hydrolase)